MKAEKTERLIRHLLDELYEFRADSSIKGCQSLQMESKSELKQLERLATEYQSPETQRLLEIGMATVEAMKEIEEERQRVFKNCEDSTDSEGKKQHFWRLTGLMFALDRLEWHKERDAK